MSHYLTLVLVDHPYPMARNEAQMAIDVALAPYSEHIEVPPHKVDCYCVNSEARRDSMAQVAVESGKSWDDLRKAFWAMDEKDRPNWEEWTKIRRDREAQIEKEHPRYNLPNKECEACKCSGKRTTTYNPKSQWDWYEIGGRWTGVYSGYDPEKDPDNIEICDLCGGTGMREGWAWIDEEGVHYKDDWAKKCKGCNGCQGEGKRLKWPTQWKKIAGDILPAANILAGWNNDSVPFAILTPDDEWIERGKMGWWGMVSNEAPDSAWNTLAKKVVEKFAHCTAVVIDCHI